MPCTVSIAGAAGALAHEAAHYLSALFPDAGTYEVASAHRQIEVALSAPAACAADPLAIWRAVFPVDGHYAVKAITPQRPPLGTRFEEWWLEHLVDEAARHVGLVHDVVRAAIERFVIEHGGTLTDPETVEQFERLLFDLRLGIRWAIAQPVSPAVERALRELGFADRHVFDFPGIAYRLGHLSDALARPGATFTWAQALAAAAEVPLRPADVAAIAVARQRIGAALTPALLRTGQTLAVAAAERERDLLRTLTADAVRRQLNARQLARELYHQVEGSEGVVRDWDRVARTEIAEARNRGAFEAERRDRGWTEETLVYRSLSAVPCNGCVMLYLEPTGMPRRYTVGELERQDALGYNQGPWRDWHARIGPTHPNCLCTPPRTWVPALEHVFAPHAETWAAEYERRRIAA